MRLLRPSKPLTRRILARAQDGKPLDAFDAKMLAGEVLALRRALGRQGREQGFEQCAMTAHRGDTMRIDPGHERIYYVNITRGEYIDLSWSGPDGGASHGAWDLSGAEDVRRVSDREPREIQIAGMRAAIPITVREFDRPSHWTRVNGCERCRGELRYRLMAALLASRLREVLADEDPAHPDHAAAQQLLARYDQQLIGPVS